MHQNKKNFSTSALILGIIAVVLFGITLPTTRIAVSEFDPYFVFIGRVLLAAVIAGVILLVARKSLPPKHLWLKLTITSAGIVIGFPLFATLAMLYAPASHGGVVLAILPLATAIASVFFANERPSIGFWLCSIFGALAVFAFAILEGAADENLQLGDFLLVAAVISAAIGYAQGGALSRQIGGWEVICWALVISIPLMIPLGFLLIGSINWEASSKSWLSFIYLALISQLLGFFIWNKALALGGIAKIGQTQLLQTFVTLLASAWLLGEVITTTQIIFAIIVVGIVAISREMRVEEKKTTKTEYFSSKNKK